MNRIEIEELRVLARSGQHFVERDAVYGWWMLITGFLQLYVYMDKGQLMPTQISEPDQ